jgi:DNA-binding IclR family transcriptional regulator
VRDLFTGVAFERQTDRTIPDIDALIRELSDVRALGYATNRGESESGVAAIAVAQRDRTGAAVAAVAVSAPEPRLPPSRHTELVDLIRQVVGPAAQFVG